MNVRLANINDIEALVELRLAMQREVNPGVAMPEEYADTVRAYFSRALADGSYVSIVVEVGGKPIGTTGVIFYDKPPSLSGRRGRNAYVSNVFTLPGCRGWGVGGAMMRALIEQCTARGADLIQLTTTEDGRGVYERAGFEPSRFPALELRLPVQPSDGQE